MHKLPCWYEVWPSPSHDSSSAWPRSLVRSLAPWYGVAGSCRLPIPSPFVGVAAAGSGTTVRCGCHDWHPNSDDADHRPNIGYFVTQTAAVLRTVSSVGPGGESLQPIATFASSTLV